MSELKAIVIGTGFGVLTHLRALRAAGFEVVALVGRDPAKTRKRAERMGVPHGLTDLDRALALPGVVAATVATPPHTHHDLVLRIVAAGKHVLCEKPFARNAAEAQGMHDAAVRAGVVHLMGTEFRFETGQALAARAMREGAIGEPRLGTFMLHVPALADPKGEVPAWWSTSEEGGGWLGAFGSHVIDQVRNTLGDFSGVSASLGLVSDRDWTADDTYTVHFRTRSGADGIIQSTAGAWGPPFACTRIAGRTGTLIQEGPRVSIADASGLRVLDVPPELENAAPVPPPPDLLETTYDMLHSMGIDLAPYTRLCEVFRKQILGEDTGDGPVAGTFADGLAVQRTMDAIRTSSAERRWVDLKA